MKWFVETKNGEIFEVNYYHAGSNGPLLRLYEIKTTTNRCWFGFNSEKLGWDIAWASNSIKKGEYAFSLNGDNPKYHSRNLRQIWREY